MIMRLALVSIIALLAACSSSVDDKREGGDEGTASDEGPDGADSGRDGESIDLTLTWDAFATPDATFNLYGRMAQDSESGVVAGTRLAANLAVTDQTAPTLTISSEEYPELKPFFGKSVCLWLTASINGVESEPSTTTCLDF